MKTDRIALALLAAALPAALLAAGCGKKETAAAAEETAHALAVRALPAAMRDFERRLTVQGTLEAKRFAHVAARPMAISMPGWMKATSLRAAQLPCSRSIRGA